MKKRTQIILQIFLGLATVFTLGIGRTLAITAYAEDETSSNNTISGPEDGARAVKADAMPENLVGPDGVFTKITNTVLYVVGIVSVIMLVYGGIRYIVSGGDNKKVTDARNTILYAIIGLIISLLAYAIVNFILNTLGASTDTTSSDTTSYIKSHTA